MAERTYIALGSNQGGRAAYLAAARSAIALLPGSRLLALSSIEETAPFGPVPQGPYLNQMIVLETASSPFALLASLARIERTLGRVRRHRWGARTIDLDIVRMGTVQLRTPSLTLPHPGLSTRDFWQREIAELDAILARAAA